MLFKVTFQLKIKRRCTSALLWGKVKNLTILKSLGLSATFKKLKTTNKLQYKYMIDDLEAGT